MAGAVNAGGAFGMERGNGENETGRKLRWQTMRIQRDIVSASESQDAPHTNVAAMRN